MTRAGSGRPSGWNNRPSGSVPSNPSDFVGSPDLKGLLEQLRESFDVILIDAPGLLRTSDAERLCQHADLAIAIASADQLQRKIVRECARTISQTPASVIGVVSTDDSTGEALRVRPNPAHSWHAVSRAGQTTSAEN